MFSQKYIYDKPLPLFLFLIFITTNLPLALYGESNSYFGMAFDQKTGQKVYTDNHNENLDGSTHISSKIEYKDPTGKVIAKKKHQFL